MASIPASHTENAAFREMVTHYWRDWRRYLQANHTLVTARQAGTADQAEALFERGGNTPTQQATVELAALPPDRRTLFEQFYAERREEVQCELEAVERAARPGTRPAQLDPDEINRTTLERLIEQAEGRSDQSGWGIVPLPDNTYRVHVAELLGQPSAELYQVRAPTDEKRRAILGVLGLTVAMLAALIWWFTRAPEEQPRTAETVQHPAANDVQLELWPISHVILIDSENPIATLSVRLAKQEEWPQQIEAQAVAYLRNTNSLPIMICAPQEIVIRSLQARIPGTGILPDRIYTLRPADGGPHDLELVPCEKTDRLVYYGTLQATYTPEHHKLGEQIRLPDGPAFQVRSITLVTSSENPAIPSNQAWVTAQVAVTQPVSNAMALDWPRFDPVLLLADGTATLPSQIFEQQQEAFLTYLITLPAAPIEVAWIITPPGAERSLRWRTTVTPPPDRALLLSKMLGVEARSGTVPGQLFLTLENRATSPLQLNATDIILTEGAIRIPVAEPAELQQPLAPGERREILLTIQRAGSEPLLLTIGTVRYQIDR